MSDIAVPRTPTPGSKASGPRGTGGFTSPPPRASQDLTPPPSIQTPRFGPPLAAELDSQRTQAFDNDDDNAFEPTQDAGFSSPPTSTRPTPTGRDPLQPRPSSSAGWQATGGRFPSIHEAQHLSEGALRALVAEALPALGEARMALAHAQLQLHLRTLAADEAARRAAVETDLARREVAVLQQAGPGGVEGSPVPLKTAAGKPLPPRTPLLFEDPASGFVGGAAATVAHLQRSLAMAVQHGQELGDANVRLRARGRSARRLIRRLDAAAARLAEDNALLRERIRQNRAHRDALSASPGGRAASVQSTPRAATLRNAHRGPGGGAPKTPRSAKTGPPAPPPAPGSNSLDALLMADQILSADATSVPSTPSPFPRPAAGAVAAAARHSGAGGHVRGTQSLSSLPATPTRPPRHAAADALRTPANQIVASTAAGGAPFTAPPAARVAAAVMAGGAPPPQSLPTKARNDRDSTISAASSDADGSEADDNDDDVEEEELLPASQASRAASDMLRRDPGGELAVAAGGGDRQQRLVQARLMGRVGKVGRGLSGHVGGMGSDTDEEEVERTRKRARVEKRGEMGLGIGLWGSPRP